MNKTKRRMIYESFMLVLIILSLALLPYHNSFTFILNWVIWVIFTLDYVVRFYRADKKWDYVRTHPFQLIAIIPFYGGFRAARIASFVHLLSITAMGKRYIIPIYNFFRSNGLNRFLMIFILLVIIIPVPMVFIEPEINNYPDALWWAIVTATTVGYGDIIPVTPIGRILATIMMLFGIAFIGMITSTITNFFRAKKPVSTSTQRTSKITQLIAETPDLTKEEIAIVEQFLSLRKSELVDDRKSKT
ncbi:potassium channel family protein [Listeria ivanovii]|uniref:Potassium channel family protein n=2 Tax=Listeria ivanovii TaxID=1638 RepID=A0ABS1G711_LISIV|nr:potassium channel family protein [Listeria ivanovii]AIS60459.1 ion transporter [Listeria ivanovii subsp. londoniensis]AIS63284.1 ion transporter [Listeria ivanovii subsp. londoniensis]MBC2255920.1 potassium channel family protein [Listeria ivanovii]MBK1962687.1 potassium channel family protein [Listeria ivanovii subsp. londoniensis]MBK1966350.1 potassium channel family protein [Listeria ivanovii subsp. londoniensis]